jgi:hypothetical protein
VGSGCANMIKKHTQAVHGRRWNCGSVQHRWSRFEIATVRKKHNRSLKCRTRGLDTNHLSVTDSRPCLIGLIQKQQQKQHQAAHDASCLQHEPASEFQKIQSRIIIEGESRSTSQDSGCSCPTRLCSVCQGMVRVCEGLLACPMASVLLHVSARLQVQQHPRAECLMQQA